MPISLEGVGCMFAAILLVLGLIWLGIFLRDVIQSDIPVIFTGMAAFGVALLFMKFVRHHS
jgi:hypothetical protein